MQPELPRILVVDDEVENLKALQRTLRASFEVVTANSAEEALPLLDKFELDYNLLVGIRFLDCSGFPIQKKYF